MANEALKLIKSMPNGVMAWSLIDRWSYYKDLVWI